jgi:hypothetical protein
MAKLPENMFFSNKWKSRMNIKKTRLIIQSGVFLLSGAVYLLISSHSVPNYNQERTTTNIHSGTLPAEPNQTSMQTITANSVLNRDLQVSSTIGIEEMIEHLAIDADKEIELAEAKIRWQQWKDSSQPLLTSSERAMKEPNYYKGLDTIKLAEECFSDHYFAGQMGVYNDPVYAFENMKFFHNAFSEFFAREDMWNGILHIYDYLLPRIDPNSTRREIISTSSTFVCLCRLYLIPVFQEQVRKNEAEKAFLAANIRALKRYQWYLENYDSEKYSTAGFFGEPCSIAQVALMLTKKVNPQKYAQIAPAITSVRWTREQKVEDLKNFIDLVITGLDGSS